METNHSQADSIKLKTKIYTEPLELRKDDGIWYLIIDSTTKTPLLWLTFEEYEGYSEKGKILEIKELEKNVAVVLAEFLLLRRLFIVQIPREYRISASGIKKNWQDIIAKIIWINKKNEDEKPPFKNEMMNPKNAKYQLLAILKCSWTHHIKI